MYKAYKKDFNYSYVMGTFPVIELIEKRPDLIKEILISSSYDDKDNLISILKKNNIPYSIDDRSINRIAKKGNVYLVGVFNKEYGIIKEGNHILLDRPSNMGNLGTIIRTMLGMGFENLAICGDACDYFDPKVIRASMGAFFKVNIQHFDSLEAYNKIFSDNELYLFMLGESSLLDIKSTGKFTLCFGNEGSGLDSSVKSLGRPVMIPQSSQVDSLNLPVSVALGMFYFTQII